MLAVLDKQQGRQYVVAPLSLEARLCLNKKVERASLLNCSRQTYNQCAASRPLWQSADLIFRQRLLFFFCPPDVFFFQVRSPESSMLLPMIDTSLTLPMVQVTLRQSQYADVLVVAHRLTQLIQRQLNAKYRPLVPIHNHARDWWFFALNATMETWRRRRKEMTWEHLRDRRHQREAYIPLYTKVVFANADTLVKEGTTRNLSNFSHTRLT